MVELLWTSECDDEDRRYCTNLDLALDDAGVLAWIVVLLEQLLDGRWVEEDEEEAIVFSDDEELDLEEVVVVVVVDFKLSITNTAVLINLSEISCSLTNTVSNWIIS